MAERLFLPIEGLHTGRPRCPERAASAQRPHLEAAQSTTQGQAVPMQKAAKTRTEAIL